MGASKPSTPPGWASPPNAPIPVTRNNAIAFGVVELTRWLQGRVLATPTWYQVGEEYYLARWQVLLGAAALTASLIFLQKVTRRCIRAWVTVVAACAGATPAHEAGPSPDPFPVRRPRSQGRRTSSTTAPCAAAGVPSAALPVTNRERASADFEQLSSLGFDASQVATALADHGGDSEGALNALLSGRTGNPHSHNVI
jgi:hypothetical protein